jgi:hypothetical protein
MCVVPPRTAAGAGPIAGEPRPPARHPDSSNERADEHFTRVGFNVVRLLKAEGAATETALRLLDVAVDFRNAIVHGNETQVAEVAVTGQIEATLTSYRRYRGVITGLASTRNHVAANEARHQPSDSATLVKPMRKAGAEPEYGEEVSFPLGLEEVHGTVHEVDGPPGHRHVVFRSTT